MTYSQTLSKSKIAKIIVFCIAKYGNVCWYCKTPFVEELTDFKRTIDHLKGDLPVGERDKFQNLVLCHLRCNNDKKTNPDMQVMAAQQYQANIKDTNFFKIESESEGVCEREKNPQADELTDGEVNRIINKTCTTYLTEHLPKDKPDKHVTLNDAANSITFLVQKETGGRGSKPAVLRALEVQCCIISEFVIDKTKRPFTIRRRDS